MLNASIIGNLGNDPELKYAASGSALLQFNLASNSRVKVDGEYTDKTEWVRCTIFGNRAESLGQHLKKGMRVFVDGRLEARPWTSRDGEIRAGLELSVSTVEFMSPRGEDEHARRPLGAAIPARGVNDDLEDLPF